jgi:hypothetical protein
LAEALWVQASGVEYNATEDRRLIAAIWPGGGTLTGLNVTPGTGRSVNVSAGKAVVPDLDGAGSYLAYFDATTSGVAVDINAGGTRTDGVYVVIDDPGSGEATIDVVPNDTPPSDPYVKIATITVAGGFTTLTTSNINNLVKVDPLDPRYVPTTRITYGPVSAIPSTLAVGVLYFAHD